MSAAALFPDCVLPGCRNPVGEVGEPCADCRSAFGSRLRRNASGQRLTEAEISPRDSDIRAAYALQQAIEGVPG